MGTALGWAAVVAFLSLVGWDYKLRWDSRSR
jgi:hypothetical protein